MKRTNYALVVGIFALLPALHSCKKADEVETELVNGVSKIEVVNYVIDNESLTFSAYVGKDGIPKWIENEANRKVLEYFRTHPECVTEVNEDGTSIVYADRESYSRYLYPENIKKSGIGSGIGDGVIWPENCGSGSADASVSFYKHVAYNTLMETKYPTQTLADITHYVDGPRASLGIFLTSDNSYRIGTLKNRKGFSVSWIGKDKNDQISSLKINSSNGQYFGNNTRFSVVLFEHANFGGKAIAFWACKQREIPNLKSYRFTWYFLSWNDKVSSYIGYYFSSLD